MSVIRCSICMATCNGGNNVERQLNSILTQIEDVDEIIVSDDGSTDGTVEIIRSINDDRIKIYNNTGKKGPVWNFENAILRSSGQYVFLADQDDIWLPGKIQKHIKAHEHFGLVISDAIVIDEKEGVIFESFFQQRGSRNGLLKNIFQNSYIGCCMSFSRQFVNKCLPFPSNIYMHDWWMGLIGEYTRDAYFLDEKLIKYVRHGSNASPTLISKLSVYKQIKNRLGLIKALIGFLLFKKIC
jgi:glycosyltransferase involved in cell wall biosynthesis